MKRSLYLVMTCLAAAFLSGCGAANESDDFGATDELDESTAAHEEAVQAPPGGAGTKTQEDLEKDGYTCEHIATAFDECTKKGSETYWCRYGECGPKPKTQPKPPILNLPISLAPAVKL